MEAEAKELLKVSEDLAVNRALQIVRRGVMRVKVSTQAEGNMWTFKERNSQNVASLAVKRTMAKARVLWTETEGEPDELEVTLQKLKVGSCETFTVRD